MASSEETNMVARALEAPASIIPYLHELLVGFSALGSDPQAITDAIRALQLPATALVVDLACGKGAVSVAIAQALGYRVHGIELYEPFVADCVHAAKHAKVEALCTFEAGDITAMADLRQPADVAVLAAVGDSIGTLTETVGIIRKYVKAGGYLVISDVYAHTDNPNHNPAFTYIASKAETERQLTAHGDEIIACYEPSSSRKDDELPYQAMRQAADNLADQHPEFADDIHAFVSSQQAENEFIEHYVADAIWVIKKL